MSKLKRQRKHDRIHAKIEQSIALCQAIIDSHPNYVPTPEQIEIDKHNEARMRAMITPEYVANMNATINYMSEISKDLDRLGVCIRDMVLREHKSTYGAVPGSTRTKRLRKKREKMVFSVSFKQTPRHELNF